MLFTYLRSFFFSTFLKWIGLPSSFRFSRLFFLVPCFTSSPEKELFPLYFCNVWWWKMGIVLSFSRTSYFCFCYILCVCVCFPADISLGRQRINVSVSVSTVFLGLYNLLVHLKELSYSIARNGRITLFLSTFLGACFTTILSNVTFLVFYLSMYFFILCCFSNIGPFQILKWKAFVHTALIELRSIFSSLFFTFCFPEI